MNGCYLLRWTLQLRYIYVVIPRIDKDESVEEAKLTLSCLSQSYPTRSTPKNQREHSLNRGVRDCTYRALLLDNNYALVSIPRDSNRNIHWNYFGDSAQLDIFKIIGMSGSRNLSKVFESQSLSRMSCFYSFYLTLTIFFAQPINQSLISKNWMRKEASDAEGNFCFSGLNERTGNFLDLSEDSLHSTNSK